MVSVNSIDFGENSQAKLDLEQKKDELLSLLLLLTAGEGPSEIWKNFSEQEKTEQKTNPRGSRSDVYQITVHLNCRHFALKEHVPKTCTNLFKMDSNPAETVLDLINHFKVLVRPCNFEGDSDNLIRDKVFRCKKKKNKQTNKKQTNKKQTNKKQNKTDLKTKFYWLVNNLILATLK